MVVIKGCPGSNLAVQAIIHGSIQHDNKTQVVAEEKIVRVGFGVKDPGDPGGTNSKTERNTESILWPDIGLDIGV